jgi:peptidoglycan/xylan/chitin deacetylase (PgdA/CDA1 family)
VARSREEVEDLVGRQCEHFSYPNGDYLERELDYVRKAGYRSAGSLDLGWNDVNTDPYRLRVQGITDDASVSMLSAQLSGVPTYLWRLTRGRWDGRWPTTAMEGGDPSRRGP